MFRNSKLGMIFGLVLLVTSTSAYAQGTLFVEGDRVGVGVETPLHKLHVRGADGATRLVVEEVSGTEAERTVYQVRNNGVTIFQVADTSANGSLWNFEAEGPSFRINKAGSGGEEIIIRNRFDASGPATFTVNGSVAATNVTFTSARDTKTDFTAIDSRGLLDKLADLEITNWTFKNEQNGRRHIGPVAEDFNSAFGLAGDEGHISLIDANGVALAGVQALYEVVREKDSTIESLRQRNDELERRLAALESAFASLKE